MPALRAIILVAALQLFSMLRVMDIALHALQATRDVALPLWVFTAFTQPISLSQAPTHAGVWGLGRACRQEGASPQVWCADVCSSGAQNMAMLIHQGTLRLLDGCVRGLHFSASLEPEAACSDATLRCTDTSKGQGNFADCTAGNVSWPRSHRNGIQNPHLASMCCILGKRFW